MHVDLYIFKVQREFIGESTRYIAKAHRFGTRTMKWVAADSLVGLHCELQPPMPAFDWGEIETGLETKGGHKSTLDLTEVEFTQLFSKWPSY
jgi:hypothetical protein